MSIFPLSPQTRRWASRQAFALESGTTLPGIELAYRSWGVLSPQSDNAVVVCHALTGSADADAWWAPLFGAGRAIDPTRDFVVCSNVLGGCYGSTGPTSLAPDGRRWGARFPRLTVRDQVRAQIELANALGIRRIRLVIGGSMGGLQALEWAIMDPMRVQAVATIAASARHSTWCMAWSEAQRMALAADPKYRDGNYADDDPPLAGLAAARGIAMISYRSSQSLGRRFDRSSGADVFGADARYPEDFAVKGWLRHHGEKLTARFDANSYRVLLDAMDTHDVGRGRGTLASALSTLVQPTRVIAIATDALYIPEEQRQLARMLPNAQYAEIDSMHGHDGFLIDAARIEPLVRDFRTAGSCSFRREADRTSRDDVSGDPSAIAGYAH